MNLSKRIFIKNAVLSCALIASSSLIVNAVIAKKNFVNNSKIRQIMPFELPKLPYERNALEPFISEETINYHYGKHHQAYVDNLNKLIAGSDLADKSLEEIIKISANDPA